MTQQLDRGSAHLTRKTRGSKGWPVPHEMRYTARVPAHPTSVGFVRKAVGSVAEVCGVAATETLCLIFTELITNSIRHGAIASTDSIDVSLVMRREGLHGSVVDKGIGFGRPAEITPSLEGGGYGLLLVNRLARRWGVRSDDGRTEVWFEL